VDSRDWDRKHAAAGRLYGAEPNRFLVAEVAALPPGRALDLACGGGRNAVWLAEHGWRVTGIDYSEVALEHAGELAAERGVELELIRADVLEHVPAAGAYDLVVVLYLQLPAAARRTALARAAAAIAPGGTMLVVAHHSDNLAEGWGGPKDAAVLYAEAEVAEDIAGLTIEKAEHVLRPVSTDDGEVQAIDTLVRARAAG
jgi:2-polyprenyl-3-methyl-5-hydroxy-6-metoxy-1,4-benzoquinol methylase